MDKGYNESRLVRGEVVANETRSVVGERSLARAPSKTTSSIPSELLENSDYQVVKVLGSGAMGMVYLAKHIGLDRLEVLKVLSERLLSNEAAKQRFKDEVRAAAKLNHPNIVNCYHLIFMGKLLACAMEYVHGMDLHLFVHKHGTLPSRLAYSFTQQLPAGLQHAHEVGFVHRDIKPSNAMVFKAENTLKLKVFYYGLAQATDEKVRNGLTHDGTMFGTADYMSPEQALNAANADIRADIYSLGCTLYYMLVGQTPFQGFFGQVLMAHAQKQPESITLKRPEIPAELESIVFKMMAKDASRRFQTPAEISAALKPPL